MCGHLLAPWQLRLDRVRMHFGQLNMSRMHGLQGPSLLGPRQLLVDHAQLELEQLVKSVRVVCKHALVPADAEPPRMGVASAVLARMDFAGRLMRLSGKTQVNRA